MNNSSSNQRLRLRPFHVAVRDPWAAVNGGDDVPGTAGETAVKGTSYRARLRSIPPAPVLHRPPSSPGAQCTRASGMRGKRAETRGRRQVSSISASALPPPFGTPRAVVLLTDARGPGTAGGRRASAPHRPICVPGARYALLARLSTRRDAWSRRPRDARATLAPVKRVSRSSPSQIGTRRSWRARGALAGDSDPNAVASKERANEARRATVQARDLHSCIPPARAAARRRWCARSQAPPRHAGLTSAHPNRPQVATRTPFPRKEEERRKPKMGQRAVREIATFRSPSQSESVPVWHRIGT
ncbi:hypothetical protein B0H17DRAFT_1196952 [Mycena rosella]|uniref:Uncharacterized protein n=1 Tax=Mycena rosella TaxID=1033263 RepID=A0AAD7DSI1_MYCRO|nr:hypothetical protein B0H17DRAFT_1196952 [Mycena rosella]